jgi:hypothetical protein
MKRTVPTSFYEADITTYRNPIGKNMKKTLNYFPLQIPNKVPNKISIKIPNSTTL